MHAVETFNGTIIGRMHAFSLMVGILNALCKNLRNLIVANNQNYDNEGRFRKSIFYSVLY
jgi:hypothetical protein